MKWLDLAYGERKIGVKKRKSVKFKIYCLSHIVTETRNSVAFSSINRKNAHLPMEDDNVGKVEATA